ncbi:MAG TPA: DUF1302 family protein, partial [Woeseiaceae bacterium]|nr:DUF1302 family protein [Woeseiaceae bacterium]
MQPDRALWHMATAAIMLAAAFPSARAAELGSLVIHSVIGQPLNGEIAIDDARPGEKLAVQPASRDTYRRAGVDYDSLLVGLRTSLERRDGRAYIRLRTEQPVRKPALPILIELRSRSGFERARYNAHIEPTAQAPVQAESGPARPTVLPSSEAAKGKAPKIESARQPGTGAVLPLSREELFGVTKQEAPASREELFGIPGEKPAKAAGPKPLEWHGYISNYTAYDYSDPEHWSRGVFRAQVGTEGGGGGLGGGLKWKFTARVDVDPVYSWTDFYPEEVRKDQRFDAWLRETYIDTGSGDFSLRLGKQNIVWGEMVGLFFADVVSARDLRDFILPDFETIRIPQWAARGEYYGENSHLELIWLPYPAVDDIGKPGAEFYPFQAPPPTGFNQRFNNEVRPARTLSNTNWGVRASTLQGGWDLSAFYYRSTDVNATFYRDVILTPTPTL